jgi:hypothetical protein
VFVSSLHEIHLSITVNTRSIFGSQFGSSVGVFRDLQCHRAPILDLDLGLSPSLEIALDLKVLVVVLGTYFKS